MYNKSSRTAVAAMDAAKHDVRRTEGARIPFNAIGKGFEKPIYIAEEAIRLGNLDWQVEKEQLFDKNQKPVDSWGIFRQDNGLFLGSVGSAYTPIQNVNGLEWPDALLAADTKGEAHYVAAGSIDGGKRIYTVARVPSMDITVGTKDKSHGYLIFENGHDGGRSATIKLVELRLVCMNGSVRVENEGSIRTIKHTKGAPARLEAAKLDLLRLRESTEEIQHRMNVLARRKLRADHIDNVMKKLFGENYIDSQNWRKQAQVQKVAELFSLNDNDAFPEQRGTAYNMYNAITNYVDNHRQMRELDAPPEQRVEAAYFGSGVALKQKALTVIEELTADIPETKPSSRVDREAGSLIDSILSKVAIN